jgi:cytochrome c-type biogenesis protein CcmH
MTGIGTILLSGALLWSTSEAERRVEARLLAPCCWLQTLEAHESPLASALRAEVRQRLGAGESAASVEDALVARFGARIRAVPRGFSIDRMGAVMFGVVGLGGLLWLAGWRRRVGRRRPPATTLAPATTRAEAIDPAWEHRLDDALDDLDR